MVDIILKDIIKQYYVNGNQMELIIMILTQQHTMIALMLVQNML
jgi:hypothetical protein